MKQFLSILQGKHSLKLDFPVNNLLRRGLFGAAVNVHILTVQDSLLVESE